MTEAELIKRLAVKYSQPEWAFIPHVRSSTGGAERIADGFAMHMYRSRGYEVCGFEVKVSRSDWLSELKNAAKAETIHRYCDRWYLVAAKGVVKDDLPLGWGLLEPHGVGLRIIKQSVVMLNNDVMDRPFIAALLRKMNEGNVPYESIKATVDEAYKQGEKSGKGDISYAARNAVERVEEVNEMMAVFEKATGIELDHYGGLEQVEAISRYVREAMKMDEITSGWEAKNISSGLKSLAKKFDELIPDKKDE